ncbi:MAG: MEDS domain-containing protein [Bacteroidetes bacterium]|nr:MEDS domain-containing protein [Bacteroidota bacterium]
MEAAPRHQCVIYDGSPAKILPAIAAHIKQKLSENIRCLYLNSPTMVAGIRSYLFAAGVDVADEIAKTSLILSSDPNHLKDGHFDVDSLLVMLEDTLNQALSDGYSGLWATGDMTWELGPDKNWEKLLEYEWKLEKFFHKYPGISGICQYHADTLPHEAICQGLLSHPALFINETLARVNPQYIPTDGPMKSVTPTADLDRTIQNLCALQPGEDLEE